MLDNKMMLLDPQNLSLVHPNHEKREYLINDLDPKPVPLEYIYVLGGGEELAIEAVPPQQALFNIMQNSYCTRFNKEMYNTLSAVEHFQQCSSLVNSAKVFYLKRTNDLASLPKLMELIEEHVAE